MYTTVVWESACNTIIRHGGQRQRIWTSCRARRRWHDVRSDQSLRGPTVSGTLSGTFRRSTSAPSSWLNVSDTISKVRFFGGEARFGFGRRDERVSVDDNFGLGTTGASPCVIFDAVSVTYRPSGNEKWTVARETCARPGGNEKWTVVLETCRGLVAMRNGQLHVKHTRGLVGNEKWTVARETCRRPSGNEKWTAARKTCPRPSGNEKWTVARKTCRKPSGNEKLLTAFM